MKRIRQALALILFALAATHFARAGGRIGEVGTNSEQKIAQIQKRLAGTMIDTKSFPEEMPLGKFLAAVRERLPGKEQIALHLDEKELGKEVARFAAAPVRCSGRRSSISALLGRALSQVAKSEELDYVIRSDGIIITRARLAAYAMVYDIGDVMREMPSLRPHLQKEHARLFEDLTESDGMAFLTQFLMNTVDLRPWEKIEGLNGIRLSVLASRTRHEEIANLFQMLRRLSGVAVVMNARLYEVDGDFFRTDIAPLFARDREGKERPAIRVIDGGLLNKILQHKLLLESEDIKLRQNVKQVFLSQHSVFRFITSLPRPGEKEGRWGTGLAGVSFEVQAAVSPDRRFLQLHLRQHASQLVGIDKRKMRDPATGKEMEVESPNVRKTSVSGTTHIPDTAPILMPVSYRPPDTDRVWLLVARPYIWIEAEEKERGPDGQTTSKSIWEK